MLFLLQQFAALTVQSAHAAVNLSDVANAVAGGLSQSFGGGTGAPGLIGIAQTLTRAILPLVTVASTFIIVLAGFKLVNSVEEEKFNEAKRMIANALIGIVLAYLAPRFVDAFYLAGGEEGVASGGAHSGAGIFVAEVQGILSWVHTLVVVLAVGMIIFSGLKVIASFGKDDGASELRRTVFGVIAGILLIILNEIITRAVGFGGEPDAELIVSSGTGIVKSLLFLLGIAATVVIVYAGLMLIMNLGNEEQFTKAKSLLLRAVIGIIIIFTSGVLISFVVDLFANV